MGKLHTKILLSAVLLGACGNVALAQFQGEEKTAVAKQAAAASTAQEQGKAKDAAEHYQQIIAAAVKANDRRTELAARNNLGTLLLTDPRTRGRALEVFKELEGLAKWAGPRHQRIYYCNIARAYELNNDAAKAMENYELALSQDSSFAPAAEGTFRVLSARQPLDVEPALKLARRLMDQSQSRAAGHGLYRTMEACRTTDQAKEVLVALVDYYVAASVGPAAFFGDQGPVAAPATRPAAENEPARGAEGEWPRLRTSISGRFKEIDGLVSEIPLAYTADWKLDFGQGPAHPFGAWSGQDEAARQAFARLLKFAGDLHARDADTHTQRNRPLERESSLRKAAARYWAAWRLDRGNTDATLYCAEMLRRHAKTLDPGGAGLRGMVDELFEEKSSNYTIRLKSQQDWENIMRLHIVLGSIFENDPKALKESGVRGAVFQWEAAVRAAERAGRPTPHLQAKLGDVYLKNDRPRQAVDEYVKSTGGLVRTGDRVAAERVCGKLTDLTGKIPLDDEKRKQVLLLNKAVKDLQAQPLLDQHNDTRRGPVNAREPEHKP